MSTKKLMQFCHPGREPEVTSVEDYLEREFGQRSMSYSCSDAMDQSNRIDYLESIIARLTDALVQSGALSGEDVLDLTCDGYKASMMRVVDEEK